MTYWTYRAYDELLGVNDGMITGPDGNADNVIPILLTTLRQQGLQGIVITKSTYTEYVQYQRLQQMKHRLLQQYESKKPQEQPQKPKKLSIKERLKLIWAIICGNNT